MKKFTAFFLFLSAIAQAVPTALSIGNVSATGATVADNAADGSNGNSVLVNSDDVFFVLRNTHASSSVTATFVTPSATLTVPGLGPVARASLAVVVAAGELRTVGPFNRRLWADSNSKLQLTYSGAGTLLVSPMRNILP